MIDDMIFLNINTYYFGLVIICQVTLQACASVDKTKLPNIGQYYPKSAKGFFC